MAGMQAGAFEPRLWGVVLKWTGARRIQDMADMRHKQIEVLLFFIKHFYTNMARKIIKIIANQGVLYAYYVLTAGSCCGPKKLRRAGQGLAVHFAGVFFVLVTQARAVQRRC